MKKLLSLLLALTMFVFALACSYNPGQNLGNGEGGGGDEGTAKEFTVSALLDGVKFTNTSGMKAVWKKMDTQEVFEAEFGEDGVARITGLNGNYKVTLQNIPDGYSYNPNDKSQIATNRATNVNVKIYPLQHYTGDGSDIYANIIEAKDEGAYRVTLTQPKTYNSKKGDYEGVVFFQFRPEVEGKYRIESWMDTTFNEVNPFVDVYFGSFAYKAFEKTQDDGGEESTYTKNFLFERFVYPDEIGNVFAFGIHATHKTGLFPVTVDIHIYRYDEHNRDLNNIPDKVPEHNFAEAGTEWTNQLSGTWTWAEGDETIVDADNFVKGEHGFYYLKNPDGTASDTILMAMISKSIAFKTYSDGSILKRPFNDYLGSPISFYGFSIGNGPVNPLQNILDMCYNNFMGIYAANARDGVYPVTDELKELFNAFAIGQRYFADGQGFYETEHGIMSTETDQWLFACGYYA